MTKGKLYGCISESLKSKGVVLGEPANEGKEFKAGDKSMYKGKECEVKSVDDESGEITITQDEKDIKVSAEDLGGKADNAKKDIKEGKLTMTNLEWGKDTAERNSNLDKYDALKTEDEKQEFIKKIKDANKGKKDIKEGLEGSYRGINGVIAKIDESGDEPKYFFSDGQQETIIENLEFFVEKKAKKTNESDDVLVDDYVTVGGVNVTITAIDGENAEGIDDDDKVIKFKISDIE